MRKMERENPETFDIVLKSKGSGLRVDEDVMLMEPFKPGCTDVSFNDLDLMLDVFNRFASKNNYHVEVIRKIHVYCRECGAYIAYVKLPFRRIPFRISKSCSTTDLIEREQRSMSCEVCHYYTTIVFDPEIHTLY